MIIYLYKKTHNKTGLQYLGKTAAQDPYAYKGSGKRWKLHLNKHGYDVTTEILKECSTNDEVKEWGGYYSKLWNVVESRDWANLKEEYGDGGAQIITEEHKLKIAAAMKGRVFTEDHLRKLSIANKGHPDYRTPEVKAEAARKASLKLKGRKKPVGFGEKIRQASLGKKMSATAVERMKAAWTPERRTEQAERSRKLNEDRKHRPILTCPHCGKQGNIAMNRYHFDNCHIIKPKEVKSRAISRSTPMGYIVTSPDGEVITIDNLREFCRNHSLNNGAMVEVSLGNRKHHKGWTVTRLL